MKTAIIIILIVISMLILMGPVMCFVSRLNHVNPFILEEEDPNSDPKSLILVTILRPLFIPLWLEKKLMDKIKSRKIK